MLVEINELQIDICRLDQGANVCNFTIGTHYVAQAGFTTCTKIYFIDNDFGLDF